MLVTDSLDKAKNTTGKSSASGQGVEGAVDRRDRWGNTAPLAFSPPHPHLQPRKKWAQQSQVTKFFAQQ